jgi:hypothetical protein
LLKKHFKERHQTKKVKSDADDGDENLNDSATVSAKPLGPEMLAFVESLFKKNKTSQAKASCAYCRCADVFKTADELSKHFFENHPYKCPKGCEKVANVTKPFFLGH